MQKHSHRRERSSNHSIVTYHDVKEGKKHMMKQFSLMHPKPYLKKCFVPSLLKKISYLIYAKPFFLCRTILQFLILIENLRRVLKTSRTFLIRFHWIEYFLWFSILLAEPCKVKHYRTEPCKVQYYRAEPF